MNSGSPLKIVLVAGTNGGIDCNGQADDPGVQGIAETETGTGGVVLTS